MPTLNDIRVRIIRIVKDESYASLANTISVDAFINEAYSRCAGLVLLPELESTGVVTTSPTASYVAIPTSWNFDRNLYLCAPVDGGYKVKVVSSTALLAREIPDYDLTLMAGDVEICTTTRTNFVYYMSPSVATNFNCAFYKKVTPLVGDTDEPVALPDFLHYELLVYGACAKIFTEIEEGNDGVMINTNKYTGLFNKAIEDLKISLRTGQSRPEPSRRSDFI